MTLATERAFLCSLRTIDDLTVATTAGVAEDHFSSLLPVWQFIRRYAASNNDVPPAELLHERFDFEPVTAGAVGYEVERLHRDYLVQAANALMLDGANSVEADPVEAINALVTGLTSLRLQGKRNIGYMDADVAERGDVVRKRYEEREAAGGDIFIGIPTGFEPLDIRGTGWFPGGVYALVGMTSAGKSAFISRTIAEAWLRKHRVLVVSPEMSRTDFGWRLDPILMRQLGIEGGPTNWGVMTGDVTPAQLEAMRKYEERIASRSDIMIVDTRGEHANITVEDVRMLARQHRAELVLIDGFKYLDDQRRGRTVWDRHLNVFKDLISITHREDQFALVMAEHTKTDYKPFDQPLATQAYMGGHTANEADVVITLWLTKTGADRRKIAVPKSRLGPVIAVGKEISFDVDTGDIGRWTETASAKASGELGRFIHKPSQPEAANGDPGFAG